MWWKLALILAAVVSSADAGNESSTLLKSDPITELFECIAQGAKREIWNMIVEAPDMYEFANVEMNGEPAVLAATRKNRPSIVALLIVAGANFEKTKSLCVGDQRQIVINEMCCLTVAANEGYEKIVKILVSVYADRNQIVEPTKRTALHFAAMQGHVNVIRHLLASDAIVDVPDYVLGATPLSLACRYGRTDVVKLLLKYGGDANFPDTANEETPLHVACRLGHAKIVRLLLVHGADPNAVSTFMSRTPLMLALGITEGESVDEIVCDLLATGADVNKKDTKLQGALHYAVLSPRGSKRVIEYLIAAGAEVNVKTEDNCTPMQMLVSSKILHENWDKVHVMVCGGAETSSIDVDLLDLLSEKHLECHKSILLVIGSVGLDKISDERAEDVLYKLLRTFYKNAASPKGLQKVIRDYGKNVRGTFSDFFNKTLTVYLHETEYKRVRNDKRGLLRLYHRTGVLPFYLTMKKFYPAMMRKTCGWKLLHGAKQVFHYEKKMHDDKSLYMNIITKKCDVLGQIVKSRENDVQNVIMEGHNALVKCQNAATTFALVGHLDEKEARSFVEENEDIVQDLLYRTTKLTWDKKVNVI